MASTSGKEDEEKLRRIEADRLEINAAYDNGYSNDSLEDEASGGGRGARPQVSISDLQDKIDRYGFIHNEKLPAKLTETEIRRNNIEKLRESKWLDMLKNWSSYSNSNSSSSSKYVKLQSRVFKGIPNSTRNIAWYKLLDVESQIKAQSGVYEKMKFLARKYSVDLRQIDLDINRTFRDNLAYKKRYCQRQVQLYNVLAAYSIYNTEIGYCQGMSNIAALLLMYLSDEERTFWALSQLMSSPKYSMHGFFKKDFPKLIRFSDKHDAIIKEFMPKLYKKFIKCNITSLLYTTKWFLQCYLDALPFSLVLRIWDVYLLKGEIVLLGMSYCILKMHKKLLVKKDMDEINEYLKNKLPNNFMFDDDIVMQKLESCIETLKRSKPGQLEAIPAKELATQPFGTFKPTANKQEMLSQIGDKATAIGGDSDKSRLAALEKMASVRLEVEKKREREERKRRKQERLAASGAGFIDDGKPIKNISDDEESDDEEEDFDDEDDDDEDDDLNPSKLSEYEDERGGGDKGSILTHQTRSSSELRQSQSSLDQQRKTSRAAREDDVMRIARNDNDYLSAHNSPVKFVPKGTRESVSSNGALANTDDRFSKVSAKPLGRMPDAGGSINRTTSMAFASPTARVMSNPPPPISPTPANRVVTNSIFTNNGYEYVRSPHGIYTRVNHLSRENSSSKLLIQHSASNIQIAAAAGGGVKTPETTSTTPIPISTKRTSSLRNVQQQQPPLSSRSPAVVAEPRTATPTKQQLHNHSLRIASIQQQQQGSGSVAVSPASISIIAQAPKQQQTVSPTYYHHHHRSSSSQAPTSPAAKPSSLNERVSLKLKSALSQDIEQCDYI